MVADAPLKHENKEQVDSFVDSTNSDPHLTLNGLLISIQWTFDLWVGKDARGASTLNLASTWSVVACVDQ